MKPPSTKTLALFLCTAGLLTQSVSAQVLFTENFNNAANSNSWTILGQSADFTQEFGFDYSTQQFVRNGVAGNIPPAPNGSGNTVGVKLSVNNSTGVATAVSLFPNGQNFSGDYALRVDMWMNYNGAAGGGSGSTENGSFGLNHSGTTVISGSAPVSDGVWFTVTGEGGASGDYRAYVGDGGSQAIRLDAFTAGFLDRDIDGIPEDEVTLGQPATVPLKLMFPSPDHESAGAPGKQWVQVEVRQRSGIATWLINGYVIAEHGNAFQSAGNVMIGYIDFFNSIADPAADNYVIFDNLRVVNLAGEPVLPVVSVTATDPNAAEPADTGTFTISLSAPATNAITVEYRTTGTAVAGSDYAALSGSVVIPAGVTSTNITVTPIDDPVSEDTETVTLVLKGKPGSYEVREAISATVEIADDGDTTPTINLTATKTNAYERIAVDNGAVNVTLSGPTTSPLTVNYTLGGTAVNGTDYATLSGSVVVSAGETNAVITVTPINNNLVDGNRTVTVTLTSGSGYIVGAATTGTVTIRDDDLPAGTVVFSDSFESGSSSNNWTRRFGAASGPEDFVAEFGFDYSAIDAPPAPNTTGSTTRGLKVTVNKDPSNAAAAVNLYATSQNFSGDYSLRFDMLMSVGTDLGGTSEHAIFGINHSGNNTNRHGTAGSDGIWFAILGDGSNNRGFANYVSTNSSVAPTFIALNNTPDFAGFFAAPPWGFNGSPSTVTNASLITGSQKIWADVEVRQQGGVYSLRVNNVLIFERTNTFGFNSGTIMLGHNDQFSSTGSLENFTVFDNVRVVSLAVTAPAITKVQVIGGNVQIDFTGATSDAAGVFTLQSAATVNGAYTDKSATIVELSPGSFRATRALDGSQQFYKIKR